MEIEDALPAPVADAGAGPHHHLPTLRIQPSRGWSSLGLPELWHHRELLYFFVWRDLKVRYKQTALGAAWALLQPLATMLVFSVFFGRLAKMPSDGIPYPLFVYAGLLPWMFFSNAVSGASQSQCSDDDAPGKNKRHAIAATPAASNAPRAHRVQISRKTAISRCRRSRRSVD